MTKKTIFWPGWLIDTPLTPDSNDFTFSVKSQSMLTTEDIARQLMVEGTEFKFETLLLGEHQQRCWGWTNNAGRILPVIPDLNQIMSSRT